MNSANIAKGLILVVEDEPVTADILQVRLTAAGFSVLAVEDGAEAILQAEKNNPDVILMDVMLPEVNGFDACQRLKENKATKDIPVIFMTALSDRANKLTGFEVGGVDYVTKPIEIREVVARISAHITIRNLQKKLSQENLLLQQEIVERQRTVEQLRQSEAKNKALLDAIPDLIFRITSDGRYLDCKNGSGLDIIIPSEKDIGKNISEVLPSEVTNLILESVHKTVVSGKMQHCEYQLQMPQGMQDYELRLIANGVDEALGIVRNVTDRKRVEQQIIHNERMAALGRLAAVLAHETNNPLQAIQSHLDLLLNYPLEPEKREEHLQIIRRQIERLHNINQPILDLARPTPAPHQQIQVSKLIRQVLTLTNKQLEQNKVQVAVDFQDVPPVWVVPDQIIQVFLNVVLNAVESVSDSNTGQFRIAICEENDQVVISFINTGVTIPPDMLPYVFEPFFTTKSDGTGLGLWISRNLIQQHRGSFTVENLPDNEGVVFEIKLPSATSLELEDDKPSYPTH